MSKISVYFVCVNIGNLISFQFHHSFVLERTIILSLITKRVRKNFSSQKIVFVMKKFEFEMVHLKLGYLKKQL